MTHNPMDHEALDRATPGPTTAEGSARPSSVRPQDSRPDISVLPAIWVLEPKRRRVADAWIEQGCVTHDCAASVSPQGWFRSGLTHRLCRGDRAIARSLTSCHDFDAVTSGDVIVVPINRRISRIGVVITPVGEVRAVNEREVLWVSQCTRKATATKADELRVMSQLKQLG